MYRVVPMKNLPKDFLAPLQLTESALARAPWFKERLQKLFE
jgi:hypothetical protein